MQGGRAMAARAQNAFSSELLRFVLEGQIRESASM